MASADSFIASIDGVDSTAITCSHECDFRRVAEENFA